MAVHCNQEIAEEAKDRELLKSIRGYPWRLSLGDVQDEPGEVPTMVATELVVPEDELPPLLPREREAEGVPRRAYIRRHVELEKYGFTQGCRGWSRAREPFGDVQEAEDFERARVEVNR